MYKIIAIIIPLFFFKPAYSQNNNGLFVLEGFIKDRDTGTIVLFYHDNDKKQVRDTARLENGAFKFSGKVAEPTFSTLKGADMDGNYINFFLEPGKQQVLLQENNFDKIKMTGSFTQSQKDTLTGIINSIEIDYSKWVLEKKDLQSELKRNDNPTIRSDIESKLSLNDENISMLNLEKLDATVKFIYDHPDSYVSATFLYGLLVSNRLKTERVHEIFITFSQRIKNSNSGNLISEEISRRRINVMAPDFTAKDLNNINLSLSDFNGKYVLINFWASWCGPCLKKFPELKQLLAAYHPKGFEIINISIDEKRENWKSSLVKYGLKDNFYNVLANKDIESKYSNVKMPIPSEILVGPDGKVLWNSMNANPESLSSILEKRFAKKY